MNRFSRINTIWRKELIDTLRDRRTLIAMIFVPMVLYPAMMLGSLQGFELQVSRLKQEQYQVAVESEPVRAWLQQLIDSDPARQPGAAGLPAEALVELAEKRELGAGAEEPSAARDGSPEDAARADVHEQPPAYVVIVVSDADAVARHVVDGTMNIGLRVLGEFPTPDGAGTAEIQLILDQTEIRSQIANAGLRGILERAGEFLLQQRLARAQLDPTFVAPLVVQQEAIASAEKVGGSILGQIVPLILIIMTITGAIYPAIDLTAGERERGTLETLMVAPVPTVDLIAGKFIVVALIAMLSATLNLLSIGGTVFLGGLGSLLTQGGNIDIPLRSLPWVLLILIPLAVMFSAVLLAVCSFARSFKEAQNYVMPVMVAAMIPAVIGILPGTRLEGPLLVMPVTNITILARDLFTGKFDVFAIVWVTLSTTLYAGAAVAVAAKLFGQEAVLFADTGSIKTIFQRRFFKPRTRPTAAQAFFLLAIVFSVNFFAQQSLLKMPGVFGTIWFWFGIAGLLVLLFVLLPMGLAAYMRVSIPPAFGLSRPRPTALITALCFGLSTWVLARVWFVFQQSWMPIPPEMEQAFRQMEVLLGEQPLLVMVLFLAVVPAVCEELFFRGFALNGLRGGLGKVAAVLVVAVAFGVYHHSAHRLFVTTALGVLLGLLVIRHGSVWPAMLAHLMHNGLSIITARAEGVAFLERIGFTMDENGLPAIPWIIGAAVLLVAGILIGLSGGARHRTLENSGGIRQDEQTSSFGAPGVGG